MTTHSEHTTSCNGPGCDAKNDCDEMTVEPDWLHLHHNVAGRRRYYDLCSLLCLLRLAEKLSGETRKPSLMQSG